MFIPLITVIDSHLHLSAVLISKRDIEHGCTGTVSMHKVCLELQYVILKCRPDNLQGLHSAQWYVHLGLPSLRKLQSLQNLDQIKSFSSMH
jgi:hypothetical protein